MAQTILVTGGAGYIGSHLAVALLDKGHRVVALDDLSRGTEEALRRAEAVGAGWIERAVGDVCDPDFVAETLVRYEPAAVVHLAAFKSVFESMTDPESYERVNAGGSEVLANAIAEAGIQRVVYASTAAVYGEADTPEAVDEEAAIQPVSPYASTKYLGEQVLGARADELGQGVIHLRFFNVCGAHTSGQLGEFVDKPQNLMPILLQGVRDGTPVTVFGTDWPTRDGTCVRDYIHVLDIVSGIEAALVEARRKPGARAYNLGTGTGSTVLEVIAAVERATGTKLDVRHGDRRPGDPAVTVADATRARTELGWRPTHGLDDMAAHAWAWMQNAPG